MMFGNAITQILKNFFKTDKDYENEYLEESKDLYDLEYRTRQISRGLAPFQRPKFPNYY